MSPAATVSTVICKKSAAARMARWAPAPALARSPEDLSWIPELTVKTEQFLKVVHTYTHTHTHNPRCIHTHTDSNSHTIIIILVISHYLYYECFLFTVVCRFCSLMQD